MHVIWFITDVFADIVACLYCYQNLSRDEQSIMRHSKTCIRARPNHESYKYVCFQCDYHTKDCNSMKKHSRLYTGQKSFTCHLCSYSAVQIASLKKHLEKTHNLKDKTLKPNKKQTKLQKNRKNVKKISATIKHRNSLLRSKEKSRISQKSLNSLRANEKKPFKCLFCSYCARQLKFLNYHVEKVH